MKPIPALALVLAAFLVGCGNNSVPVDREAASYLGEGPVHVLSEPTKIEGWNFQRKDGTIANEPPIRPLDLSIARNLAEVLLSETTYRQPGRGGPFAHDVGFRVWRNDESVDVLLSFGNDQMQIKYRAYNGQPTMTSASIAASRDRLIRIVRQAYPDYTPLK